MVKSYEGNNCEIEDVYIIQYIREGDMLIIPIEGPEPSAEITTLTNTTLTLLWGTGNEDVSSSTYTRQ